MTGQDGSYLAEHLLAHDYQVFGLIRRNSITEHQQNRIEAIEGDLHKQYGDLLDASSVDRLMRDPSPMRFTTSRPRAMCESASRFRSSPFKPTRSGR